MKPEATSIRARLRTLPAAGFVFSVLLITAFYFSDFLPSFNPAPAEWAQPRFVAVDGFNRRFF